MKTKKNLLFIGAINDQALPLGGEEYKNQLILAKLKKESINITYIDTINWKKSVFLLLRLFLNLLFCKFDKVVLSASSVSTYHLLFLINLFKPSLLKSVSYLVIGGYFPEGIQNGRFDSKIYGKLESIVVEGFWLKRKLENYICADKIKVIPNFKNFPKINFPPRRDLEEVRFVFVGRITKAKGVCLIQQAVLRINQIMPDVIFYVDFYGPLEEQFEFDNLLCRYKGYLDFNNDSEAAYKTLNSYDCFLFPTMWKGEGFPGVIIDAYIAGLPVIASDWNMNNEIVKDCENGFLIDSDNIEALASKMLFILNRPEELTAIRQNNIRLANDYHIDKIWPELYKNVV